MTDHSVGGQHLVGKLDEQGNGCGREDPPPKLIVSGRILGNHVYISKNRWNVAHLQPLCFSVVTQLSSLPDLNVNYT